MGTLVFGANGYLGRHLVARLARDGAVTGLVRSDAAAATVHAAGGTPRVASLDDRPAVHAALADHDRIVMAAQLLIEPEQAFVRDVLAALAGTNKTFVFTSGTGVLSERTDGHWSEHSYAEDEPFAPRTAIVTEIYRGAKASGAACYMGPGLNCYSNVHVEDLAELYALALERAPAGALYHAVSGELPFRVLAEAVARHLGVPARSVDYAQARAIYGASSTAIIFAASSRSRSPRARGELGWAPSPDRLDLIGECAHPAYITAADRPGSWIGAGG